MPAEMRRPTAIKVDDFVAALDDRLRAAAGNTRMWAIPERLKHAIRTLKTLATPTIRGGAIVLTAAAVIIAVGATSATVGAPIQATLPLAAPTVSADLGDTPVTFAAVYRPGH